MKSRPPPEQTNTRKSLAFEVVEQFQHRPVDQVGVGHAESRLSGGGDELAHLVVELVGCGAFPGSRDGLLEG
jgi:hypothetical protein